MKKRWPGFYLLNSDVWSQGESEGGLFEGDIVIPNRRAKRLIVSKPKIESYQGIL